MRNTICLILIFKSGLSFGNGLQVGDCLDPKGNRVHRCVPGRVLKDPLFDQELKINAGKSEKDWEDTVANFGSSFLDLGPIVTLSQVETLSSHDTLYEADLVGSFHYKNHMFAVSFYPELGAPFHRFTHRFW